MREEFDMVRDLLDKQVVDRDETKMGRVDGVVLLIDESGQPRIERIEMGFAVLSRRIGPRFEQWFLEFRERWSVRRSARQLVPWDKVSDLNSYHVKIDVEAKSTPAFDWERWLRDHVIAKIPGAGGS